MTFQNITNAVNAIVRAEVEEAGQITLGEMIAALEACKSDAYLEFGFAGLSPGKMRSYRGYYDHLAIEPDGTFTSVGFFLAHCREVLGSTMTGYKGGDFVMGPDTPVWVAQWGNTSNTRVVGVQDKDYRVILKTIETDD